MDFSNIDSLKKPSSIVSSIISCCALFLSITISIAFLPFGGFPLGLAILFIGSILASCSYSLLNFLEKEKKE